MKRFTIPFLLLFILMALTVKQATPQRAAALYDHPSQADQMPPVRTFNHFTTFERELRVKAAHGYRVASVPTMRTVEARTEGKVRSEHDARRWHRAQTWRRSF